jgi:hypothetical protein
MWDWFRRLWDYLRRLFMNGDDAPPAVEGRPDPSRRIGEELQEFFLELLKDGNLKRYQSIGREAFIAEYDERRTERLSDDARRLLNSEDLREIEAHIGQIQSTRAVLLYVVCPPM